MLYTLTLTSTPIPNTEAEYTRRYESMRVGNAPLGKAKQALAYRFEILKGRESCLQVC